ncbi:MAG: cytochrome c5 family protein [Chlorobiales bacterium]|jgi:cytochrome c5|nr:cytochrome c5 family protein [Chlorobiales bacterium]
MSRILSLFGLCIALVLCFGISDANAQSVTKDQLKSKYKLTEGKKLYDENCMGCHKIGAMGAPKTGDKAGWTARIATGMDAMVKNSFDGYKGKAGMMPAKGGNAKLTKDQVGNAVAYMVDQSL